ncbi:alpha/beta hydrolase [Nocardia sp. NBC_00508]|uniref:alpha/beta fold hydrolase n=1 Tax=Nocardia sp. NBC_00508 TaxID=2975992 RepID=UPI002E818F56|nr:alpha/beta hydrolase [Nocardia sp. NBC_00508]WUD65739.1 alpha/beta hydrolase [Nocardia sp. NBC_00508]
MASKPPLVLLHGVTMSERVWDDVTPLLATRHEVITPTAVGHRGGPPALRRPARVEHLVDDIERRLDALGLRRVHIAGNSLGGWMAIELARRGRAATVCALSPAGFWDSGSNIQSIATRRIAREAATGRRLGFLAPLGLRSAVIRRVALRNIAVHGDRISPAQAMTVLHDLLACTVTADLLGTDEQVASLDPLPCPITVAWSENDRVLPAEIHAAIARVRLPEAAFSLLPGVGHVPMIDDPELVARTILAITHATAAEAS